MASRFAARPARNRDHRERPGLPAIRQTSSAAQAIGRVNQPRAAGSGFCGHSSAFFPLEHEHLSSLPPWPHAGLRRSSRWNGSRAPHPAQRNCGFVWRYATRSERSFPHFAQVNWNRETASMRTPWLDESIVEIGFYHDRGLIASPCHVLDRADDRTWPTARPRERVTSSRGPVEQARWPLRGTSFSSMSVGRAPRIHWRSGARPPSRTAAVPAAGRIEHGEHAVEGTFRRRAPRWSDLVAVRKRKVT